METLTSDVFARHVGERFELVPPGGEPFEAVLESCDETPYGTPDDWRQAVGRVPFSLVFLAEDATGAYPQQVFSVRHPDAGAFEMFLVPIGPPAGRREGMRYEAVFS